MRRGVATLPLASAALASLGAAEAEEREMLAAFDGVLTAMGYAGAGLCLFSIVWAGFVLMAEGAGERGGAGPGAPSWARSWDWSSSSRPRASPSPSSAASSPSHRPIGEDRLKKLSRTHR